MALYASLQRDHRGWIHSPARTVTLRRIGLAPRERDAVWFSTHPFFEQTALPAWCENGVRVPMTLEQLVAKGPQFVRFGVDDRYPLHDMKAWRKKARVTRSLADDLETTGRQRGADPRHWWVSFTRVSVEACRV